MDVYLVCSHDIISLMKVAKEDGMADSKDMLAMLKVLLVHFRVSSDS